MELFEDENDGIQTSSHDQHADIILTRRNPLPEGISTPDAARHGGVSYFVKQNQLVSNQNDKATAKLTADRPGSSGNHNGIFLEKVSNFSRINMDFITPQQIFLTFSKESRYGKLPELAGRSAVSFCRQLCHFGLK